MISEKQGSTKSAQKPGRSVKLHAETVRSLAIEQQPTPSVFTNTCTFQNTCHSCTCTIYHYCVRSVRWFAGRLPYVIVCDHT
jgi:hypothetical protein